MHRAAWIFSILVLFLYPLRHVNLGVDLWDGGYNYANFRYNSLEYMDSMWYFATWLANTVGSMFTRLPYGKTLVGMNVYTGLIVSIIAAVSYFFCVKKLRISAPIAFVGVLTAETLCWVPTLALYDYLTYLFLLVGICLLYQGLVSDKSGYLVAAGVMLGLNVGNRFSNLVQAGLIVAVWAYGVFDRKDIKKIVRQTGLCILGYLAALTVFLLVISLRYGLADYAAGISRLFEMTENAPDYAPGYMLLGLVRAFAENESRYWAKRFILLFGISLVVCLLLPTRWEKAKKAVCVFATAGLIIWLRRAGFSYPDYATYEAIYGPCVILFEMLAVLSLLYVFDKKAAKEERLTALLLILVVFLTSLGGNNAMYSSINNTFLTLPGFLGLTWKFCRNKKAISAFPVKCILFASIASVLIACVGFGQTFVYEEATGGRNMDTEVKGVPALSGMRTDAQKAESLSGLYRYLSDEELRSRECILYGNIPGVSSYMELAPAMNVWSDLRSYSPDIMAEDIEIVRQEGISGGEFPLVILGKKYADHMMTGEGENLFYDELAEEKLRMLGGFMEEMGYEITYYNERFAVYQAK